MKHMSFRDFLKEDTGSADIASVETKLNLTKRDTPPVDFKLEDSENAEEPKDVKEAEEAEPKETETEVFHRKCKEALKNEGNPDDSVTESLTETDETDESEEPKETEENK